MDRVCCTEDNTSSDKTDSPELKLSISTDSSSSQNNSDEDHPLTRSEIINRNKQFYKGILAPKSIDKDYNNKIEPVKVHLSSYYSGIVEIECFKKKDVYLCESIIDGYRIKVIDYEMNDLSEKYIYPVEELLNLPPVELKPGILNYNVDVLYAIEHYLKMLKENNIEFKLKTIVCISGVPINNCYWNSFYMTLGTGNHSPRKSQLVKPLYSVDIIAHELTHALIEQICDLTYSGESGALNESIADILGVCCDYYTLECQIKQGNIIGDNNVVWAIGSRVKINALRSLSDPHSHGHPKMIGDKYWYVGREDYGGVHTNSGVINWFFFRLCKIRPIYEAMCIIIDALKKSHKNIKIRDFIKLMPEFYIAIE